MKRIPQCDRQVYDCLKEIGFEEVADKTPDEALQDDFREIVVECDECGNTTITSHFMCGEFLPISMFCVRCMKYVSAHAHYRENGK